jgi:hypothetical protein
MRSSSLVVYRVWYLVVPTGISPTLSLSHADGAWSAIRLHNGKKTMVVPCKLSALPGLTRQPGLPVTDRC